ncbi:MAG: LysM peptidoglycan-binding domain-containing M23 family metallopeptidase [Chloroflexota bacterium]|nr:LysM peptidoglycan-binding domain-containing M23 family metallopeptidase [Chloroflexota bacterium]
MLRKILVLSFLCLILLLPANALAQPAPPELATPPQHVVRSGETLFSIAQRYGTDVPTLARLNRLSDPRHIYVGQQLSLVAEPAGVDLCTWDTHRLQMGESFSWLAQRGGLAWETFAEANKVLNSGALLVGEQLLLPPAAAPTMLAVAPAQATPLLLALRHNVPFWEVLRLNPQPLYAGAGMLLPGEGPAPFLPYPLAALDLTPQPIVRGQTAILALETVAPATCEVYYLDHAEPCYAQDPTHLFAFISLSPMLDPATYPVNLRVRSEGSEMALELPLVVSPGRFGYEVINVGGSRQHLMDPTLLRAEADKVNAVARVRTPQRYWQVPLRYPVQAAISSYFGARRSYGGAYNSYHAGMDFRACTGTPVHVPAGGVVVLADPLVVRGNAIMVDHGWGLVTGYWHLSKINVAVGDVVTQGEVIGRVGNTGLSTGSHLHWQTWVNGTPVNPLQWVEAFYPFPAPAVPPAPVAEQYDHVYE